MATYGSMIEYDTAETPIVMKVDEPLVKTMENKFEQDYGLPFTIDVAAEDKKGVFTFDESVDAETFLRHLKTASPEEYEALAKA